MYSSINRPKGFTIIELLVVIVIIGLLTTLATTSYLNAQRSARDSARKAKVSTVSVAVEAFYRDKQRFPGQTYNIAAPGSTYLGNVNGCEFYDSSTQDFVYAYFPTKIDGSGNTATDNCNSRAASDPHYTYTGSDYKPYPNWIPGLGDYMNPAPTETRYVGNDGSESTPLYSGTRFFDPLTDSSALAVDTKNVQTIFYRKLKGGYAVYAKLELSGDKDSVPANTTYQDAPTFNNDAAFKVSSPNLYVIRK